jgi:hypothetical protein
MKTKQEPSVSSSYDALYDDIKGIAEHLQALNEQAVREYAPIVEDIINSNSRDTNYIEHTLDGLVSLCGDAPAVEFFKKLCRYYWQIDPSATASYVKTYREMWDS